MRAALTLLALVVVAGCEGSFGTPTEHRNDVIGGSPVPACPVDPDCGASGIDNCDECATYWQCEYVAELMRKICVNPGPDYPDGTHDWVCEDLGGTTVCRGTEFPDGGGDGDWVCERSGEFVVCTSETPDYPQGEGDGPWDCRYEGEFRICESGGDSGDGGGWTCYDTATGRECRNDTPDYPDDREWSCYDAGDDTFCTAPGDAPDGGGDGSWRCEDAGEFVTCSRDNPEYPDGGGDGEWDCYHAGEFRICRSDDGGGDSPPPGGGDTPGGGDDICVAGTQRWCDDAMYCSWGKQTCTPDGHWGPCIEPEVTASGLTDRPNNACGCRYFYFNWDCCEDQEDRDGDGNPDCIIPVGHTAPACPSDGSLCSTCDVHGDCGGAEDMCLFARDGYAFCSEDCTSSACPGGYTCEPIATRTGVVNQCVPDSGRCE